MPCLRKTFRGLQDDDIWRMNGFTTADGWFFRPSRGDVYQTERRPWYCTEPTRKVGQCHLPCRPSFGRNNATTSHSDMPRLNFCSFRFVVVHNNTCPVACDNRTGTIALLEGIVVRWKAGSIIYVTLCLFYHFALPRVPTDVSPG